MVDSSATIQDTEDLSGLATGVPSEGKIEKVVERQLGHFWVDGTDVVSISDDETSVTQNEPRSEYCITGAQRAYKSIRN